MPSVTAEVLSKLATLREAFALKASRFTPVQVQARAGRMRVGQAKRRTAAAVARPRGASHERHPPAATRAYLALPYAYSLAQELSASERQPLHRQRDPRLLRSWPQCMPWATPFRRCSTGATWPTPRTCPKRCWAWAFSPSPSPEPVWCGSRRG